MSYNGANKSVADHVVDLTNGETILMDYDRDPEAVYRKALPYLEYADSTPDRMIRVGVAINMPPGVGPPNSWATQNETELAELMAAAQPMLSQHRSFVGYAVFHDGTWYPWANASIPGVAPAGTRWPIGTSVWYTNHSMIVDPDPTTLNHWMEWSKARGISQVYIAPHAGDVALIMIPGKEGSLAAEAKFCDFIIKAGTQGLGVRIEAGTPGDLRFVKNCANRPY